MNYPPCFLDYADYINAFIINYVDKYFFDYPYHFRLSRNCLAIIHFHFQTVDVFNVIIIWKRGDIEYYLLISSAISIGVFSLLYPFCISTLVA